MRLLHTSTFKLVRFFDRSLPPYAILSHTWGDDEITLQEMEGSTLELQSLKVQLIKGKFGDDGPSGRKGMLKIVGSALQAVLDGFEYIWIDTCCIDKTSSAELSEAINSMYHWYEGHLCYAYLTDVPPHQPDPESLLKESVFPTSRWFTRGWTLQELIAPSSVVFFDSSWASLGTRSELCDIICEITGIDKSVLGGKDPGLCSIAKRMSWASKRETTRAEDIAYCLMGLFKVKMPLLYGERERAFIRLQEEIMKLYDDHSLFAWKAPQSVETLYCGLMATSPAYFAESQNVVPVLRSEFTAPYSMTNRCLSISLRMVQTPGQRCFAMLDCKDAKDSCGPLSIYLYRADRSSYFRDRHVLAPANTFTDDDREEYEVRIPVKIKTIHVRQHFAAPTASSKIFPNDKIAVWNSESQILDCEHGLGAIIYLGREYASSGLGATAYLGQNDEPGLFLHVGFSSSIHPRCAFDDGEDMPHFERIWFSEVAKSLPAYRSGARIPDAQHKRKILLEDSWICPEIGILRADRHKDDHHKFLPFEKEVAVSRRQSPKNSTDTLPEVGEPSRMRIVPIIATESVGGKMMFSLRFDFQRVEAIKT